MIWSTGMRRRRDATQRRGSPHLAGKRCLYGQTLITPCYNPGRFLMPMLESVAQQSPYVARHVVMDGGSSDGSVLTLEKWAKAHPYFAYVSEQDRGQSDACQKALGMVETDYFYWLNADDVMLPNSVHNLSAALSNASRPAIVYGDYLRIDGRGNVLARRRQPSFNYWDCLHGYITVQNVAAIFNASLLRSLGGFNPSLRFAMDYDVVLKLARLGEVLHVNSFCGAFRIHSASKTSTLDSVCKQETYQLRTEYGVTTNPAIRRLQYLYAKMRVAWRMLSEGCLKGRMYD